MFQKSTFTWRGTTDSLNQSSWHFSMKDCRHRTYKCQAYSLKKQFVLIMTSFGGVGLKIICGDMQDEETLIGH